MPITIAVLLVAISFAVLVLIAAAAALARFTHKPHYTALAEQWSRAFGIAAGVAVAHVMALALLTSASGQLGVMDAMGSALASNVYGCAVAGCVAVGLATAGGYAQGLARFPDDYAARSAFRIAAVVALVGLIGLPLVHGASALAVAGSIIVALAAVAAITWLWHAYPREPNWLLRAYLALSPFGVLAVLALRPTNVPVALANETWGAIVAVDVLLFVLGVVLFQRLAGRYRPDVRSLAAFTMEVARHGGR